MKKASLTPLGVYLRILRVKHNETQGQLAQKLGTKGSFISAVENGTKKLPQSMQEKIIQLYALDESDQQALERAILDSQPEVVISIRTESTAKRRCAQAFEKAFARMDDSMAERLTFLLDNGGELPEVLKSKNRLN
jgi:transcriptional regulator with XRE-family HTH domain